MEEARVRSMDKQLRGTNGTEASLLFLTPYFHQGRGNATTAKRIVSGLQSNDVKTNVVAYDEEIVSSEVLSSSELLHVLHFRRFADWLEQNSVTFERPFVITSGGTDVNIDIFKEEHAKKIGTVLKRAAAITVFSEDAKLKLCSVYRGLEEKVYIIKQSVWFPETDDEVGGNSVELPQEGLNIVLPAGLRAVKDVLFVLPALVKLKDNFPNLTFTIIGAPLEDEVLREVREAMKKYPWIQYYEEVALEEMASIYNNSDMIINTSLSEGQSSALLEAMYVGKPVIARNNGGNRSIIQHGETGFLFDDVHEFYQCVEQLLTDESLRVAICKNASKYVKESHSLQHEIESYVSLYEKVLGD